MRILGLAVIACMLASGPVLAGGKKSEAAPSHVAASQFSSSERRLIGEYVDRHGERGASLPPGIAKKLARGGRLPPGIAKQRLPTALEAQLPPVPAGYERVVVDGRILLVEIASQIIHDALLDVVLR